MMLLDHYFKRPLLYDVLIGASATSVSVYLNFKHWMLIPKEDTYISVVSDMSNVSLTSAGFILTLLTLLITFKSSSTLGKNDSLSGKSIFDVFIASGLYLTTVQVLKNCIKALIITALAGYILKLCLSKEWRYLIFYFNFFAITMLVLSLWRCLLILSKIIGMQEDTEGESE